MLRKFRASKRLSIAAGLISALGIGSSQGRADTFTWIAAGSGFWNTSSNWDAGVPVSGSANSLSFGATGTSGYSAVDDLASFTINAINLNNATTNNAPVILAPVTGTANTLTFAQNATGPVDPTLTNSGTGPVFVMQPLTVTGTNFTIGGSGTGTMTLAGSASGLSLGSATITKTGNFRLVLPTTTASTGTPTAWNFNGGSVEVFGSATGLGGAAPLNFNGGELILSHTASFTAPAANVITVNAGGGKITTTTAQITLTLGTASQLTGSGTLTKSGNGYIAITAANSGFTGGLTIDNGKVTTIEGGLGTSSATAPILVNSGGTFAITAAATTVFSSLANRPLTLNGTGFLDTTSLLNSYIGQGALQSTSSAASVINTLSQNITLGSNSSIRVDNASAGHVLVLSGVISDGGSGFGIAVDGGSTLRLTNANTYTGFTNARYATVSLRDGGSILSNRIDVGGLNASANGQFQIDQSGSNPTANRLLGSAPQVNLRGGTLSMLGNASAASSTLVPTLNLVSGVGGVIITTAAGGTTSLNITTLNRSVGANLAIRATSLGSSGANTSQVTVGNLASLPTTDFVGTGSPTNATNTSAPVLRYGAQIDASQQTVDFLTYGANGLTPLASTQYQGVGTSLTGNLGTNVRLTAATSTTGDSAINSLMMGTATGTAANYTLTIAAGHSVRVESGLIAQPLSTQQNVSGSATGVSVLEFGSREAVVLGGSNNISAFVSTTGGLTRGMGVAGNSLLLGNIPNSISGPIAINSNGVATLTAFLNFGNENSLGLTSNPITFGGGAMTYNGPSVVWNRSVVVTPIGGVVSLGSYSTTNNAQSSGDAGQSVTWSNISGLPGEVGGLFQKSGPGTLVLSGSNTFTSAIRLSGGVLSVSDETGLGGGVSLTATQGRGSPDNFPTISPTLLVTSSFTTSKPIQAASLAAPTGTTGTALAATANISINAGATLTLQGTSMQSSGTTLVKQGAGTLAIEGVMPFGQPITLTGGPGLRQESTGGMLVVRGATGALPAVTQIRVNGGSTFQIDNSAANNNDRLLKSMTMSMNGGTFSFVGNGATSSYQYFGTLTLVSQSVSRVDLSAGTVGNASLFANSLSRTLASASGVIFSGTNLGSSPAANTSNIFFSTAPTLTGGTGTAGTTNRPIIGGAIGDTTYQGAGSGLVTYDPRFGVRLLDNATEYAPLASGAANATDNVRLGSGVTDTLTASKTVNSLVLAGGATLAGAGFATTVSSGTIASVGSSINTIQTDLPFAALGGYFFVNADLTTTGQISGTGNIARTGGGTLTLSGPASFTGKWTLDRGVTAASTSSLFGSSVPNATAILVLDNGAVLRNATGSSGVQIATSTTASIFVSAGGGTFDTNGIDSTWDVGMTGGSNPGRFTKTGSGTLNYSASSTTYAAGNFPGGIEVTGGTFVYSGTVTNTIYGGAPVKVTGANSTFRNNVTNNIGSISGDGVLDLGSTTAVLTVGNSSAQFLQLLGVSGSLLPDTTFSGRITGTNTSGFTKAGMGTLTLTGNQSDYTGPTTILLGTIVVGADISPTANGPLGRATSPILVGNTTPAQGALDYAALLTSAPVTISRDVTLRNATSVTTGIAQFGTIGQGTTTFTGNLTLGVASSTVAKTFSLRADTGGILDMQGLIAKNATYTGGVTLEKTGGGQVIFSNGNNTYDGRTVLAQGELVINANSSSGTVGPLGASALVLNSGVLSAATGTTRTIQNAVTILGGGATIGGSQTGNLVLAGSVNLGLADRSLTVNNARTTISGVVSGSNGATTYGLLTKRGAGTLELTGSNTYSGGTNVAAGTLLVNNTNGSGTGSGLVTVAGSGSTGSGGTLSGTGTIAGGITLSSTNPANYGGTVSPGSGAIGSLNVSGGTTTWNPQGSYLFEHDVATSNGDLLNGSGSAALSLANLGTADGQRMTFNLVPALNSSTASETPITYTVATFSQITLPTGFSGTDLTPYFTFTGQFVGTPTATLSGNSVQLTFQPVPEPAHILLVAGLAGSACQWLRRRRSSNATL